MRAGCRTRGHAAPIAEDISKALGVLLIFWLLRAEFDNMRDDSCRCDVAVDRGVENRTCVR
jgi:hypothetical protein